MRVKLFNEAQEWLFAQDEKDPFSFLNVCEILNFDPNYLRRGIQARIQASAAQAAGRTSRRTDRLKRDAGSMKARSHTGPRTRAGV